MILRVEATNPDRFSCEAAVLFDAFYRAALQRLGTEPRCVGDYELVAGRPLRGATEFDGPLPAEISDLLPFGIHAFTRDVDRRRVTSFCRVYLDGEECPDVRSCRFVTSGYLLLEYCGSGRRLEFGDAAWALESMRKGVLP